MEIVEDSDEKESFLQNSNISTALEEQKPQEEYNLAKILLQEQILVSKKAFMILTVLAALLLYSCALITTNISKNQKISDQKRIPSVPAFFFPKDKKLLFSSPEDMIPPDEIPLPKKEFIPPQIPTNEIPPMTPRSILYNNQVRWNDRQESWQICLNGTEPIKPRPPLRKTKKFLGCVTYMLGSNPKYLGEIVASFDLLSRSLIGFYPDIAVIVHYHTANSPQNLERLRNEGAVKGIKNIFFEPFSVPPAGSPVSSKNPEPIPNQVGVFWLEYRYQSFVFAQNAFTAPAAEQCEYIMRIDADITVLEPFNYNPFLFAKMHHMPYMIHHWGYESGFAAYSCASIRPATALFVKSRPKEWFSNSGIVQESKTNKGQLTYNWKKMAWFAFNGGGAFTIIKRDLFASQPIRNYMDYLNCLGGTYTHRWTEQMILPLTFSMFFNFGRKAHLMNDVPILHGGMGYPPHIGVQEWPRYEPEISEKPLILPKTMHKESKLGLLPPPRVYKGCFAIFQSFEMNDSKKRADKLTELAKTLRNLYIHGVKDLKTHKKVSYPIVLLYSSKIIKNGTATSNLNVEDKFSKEEMKYLMKQVEDDDTALIFHHLSLPSAQLGTEAEFWYYHAWNDDKARMILANYETVVRIESGVNFLYPIQFDIFQFFADVQYDLGFFKVFTLKMVDYCRKLVHTHNVPHRTCLLRPDYDNWQQIDGTRKLHGWGVGRFSRIWEPNTKVVPENTATSYLLKKSTDLEMLSFVSEKAKEYFGAQNQQFSPPTGFMYLGPIHILRTETFLSKEYSDFSKHMFKLSTDFWKLRDTLPESTKSAIFESFSHIFSGESFWPLFIGFERGPAAWKSVHHFAQLGLNYKVDDSYPESHFFGVGRTTETLTSHYLDGFPFEYENWKPCNPQGVCPPLDAKPPADISEIVYPGIDEF